MSLFDNTKWKEVFCLRRQHTLMDNHTKHIRAGFLCFRAKGCWSFLPSMVINMNLWREERPPQNRQEKKKKKTIKCAPQQGLCHCHPTVWEVSVCFHRFRGRILTPIWASAKNCLLWRRSRSPSGRAPWAEHIPWPVRAPASTEAVWADSETLYEEKKKKTITKEHDWCDCLGCVVWTQVGFKTFLPNLPQSG